MQLKDFRSLINEVKKYPKTRLCVAAAADETVLRAIKDALGAGLVNPLLVGDMEGIWNISVKISLDLRNIEIISQPDPIEATRQAVNLTSSCQADVLMKGMVNSTDFLKEVMRRENGLSSDNLLSHLAIFEVPGFNRFLFKTDGGLNISPDLGQKKQIIMNAVNFMHTIGIVEPKVAVISAWPVDGGPAPPSAAEAEKLKEMAGSGQIKGAVISGPLDLGPSINIEEAELRGMKIPPGGQADLIIVPNIEVGNVIGKAIIHFAGGKMAGLVVGAKKPVIMTSRAETSFGRLSSIAMACYYMARSKTNDDTGVKSGLDLH